MLLSILASVASLEIGLAGVGEAVKPRRDIILTLRDLGVSTHGIRKIPGGRRQGEVGVVVNPILIAAGRVERLKEVVAPVGLEIDDRIFKCYINSLINL